LNKNFWGPADDEEPLPEWMDPKTYSNPKPKRSGPSLMDHKRTSLMESIQEAMRKPPVPVIIDKPSIQNENDTTTRN